LHSILHSNRAFAYIKLKKFAEAETDCSAALAIKAGFTKAQYRRAMARFELGKYEEALKDVDTVVKELPDPKSKAEAADLKKRIEEKLKKDSPKAVAKPDDGFKRMQIVEASDSDEEPAQRTKPASPKKAAEPAKPASPKSEFLPEIQVECTSKGIEKGKDQGNAAFGKGSAEEATKWFSKCLWLIEENRVKGVTSDLQSILHSNRALAYIKLKRCEQAETDCSAALTLNAGNTKATYRRAIARFELGNYTVAMEDIDKVLKGLPDPKANPEAVELKRKIQEQLALAAPKDGGKWQKLQVVEDDDESDDDMLPDVEVESSAQGIIAAKDRANKMYLEGNTEHAVKIFSKCLWLIDTRRAADVPGELHSILHSNRALANMQLKNWQDVEADCGKALALNSKNTKAKYRRALAYFELGRVEDSLREVDQVLKEVVDAKSSKEATELKARIDKHLAANKAPVQVASAPKVTTPPPQLSEGFKKVTIVESNESDDDVAGEEFPDIKVELSQQGIENAKDHANRLFAQGSFDESVRWFSKCLYLLDSKRVKGITGQLHSVLHSNRAFAHIKLKDWKKAETDCSQALSLNSGNMKAQYRRAVANLELGKAEAASKDVEKVIASLAEPGQNPEAFELKRKIDTKLSASKPAPSPKLTPLEAGRKYLEESKTKPDVITLKSGLQYKVLTKGAGKFHPHLGAPCECHYAGTLIDGTEFDSSYKRGQPTTFAPNQVIKGWTEAMQLMVEGDKWEMYIPMELAYGAGGRPPTIPGGAALVFQMEILRIKGDKVKKREEVKEEAPAPAEKSAPSKPARKPPQPEVFPELRIEFTRSGVEKAREQANALFSKGSIEEAARWFTKCLWLIESGQVQMLSASDVDGDKEWSDAQRTALHSNRAFAYIKLGRWEEAESDCSSSLSLSPGAVKALYRRAMARVELERFEAALEDIDAALKQQPDSADLLALRDRTRERLKPKTKTATAPARLEESSSSPSSSPVASPSSRKSPTGLGPAARAATSVRAAPAPKVPEQSPKNSVELLRNFHSMKKFPEILARYVHERVPPSLVQSIFSRTPAEPDDLATLIVAIKSNMDSQDVDCGPAVVGDYLKGLLKTNSADIQFGMLTDSEKDVVRELLAALPADAATKSMQASFKKILH